MKVIYGRRVYKANLLITIGTLEIVLWVIMRAVILDKYLSVRTELNKGLRITITSYLRTIYTEAATEIVIDLQIVGNNFKAGPSFFKSFPAGRLLLI